MVLSFGPLTVSSNLTLSPNELKIAPIASFTDKSDISFVLYDRIANYLHYFKYNNTELFPYLTPTRKSQYVFLIFNSTNLDIPALATKLRRENFTNQIEVKQLGKMLEKVVFNVTEGNTSMLNKLSNDLLIAEALKMTTTEIANLCKSDPLLAKRLCENKEFLRQLASKYLTSDPAFARSIQEQSFSFIANVINLFYEDTDKGISIKNIRKYWPTIEFLDKVLINLYQNIDRNSMLSDQLTDKIIQSVIDAYKIDDEYNYTLSMIIPKIFTGEHLIRIYYRLLLTIIDEDEKDPAKNWPKLADKIIAQMSDVQFDILLDISYGEDTRELLELLVRYIPIELQEEYRNKYIGNFE
jgi:hypothetical protein